MLLYKFSINSVVSLSIFIKYLSIIISNKTIKLYEGELSSNSD